MKDLIFLVGMPGCGKSHLGAQLSKTLGIPCIDIDERIEQREGLSIPQIFEQQGEEAFRRIEREVLQTTAYPRPCIISTGGGAPCFFDNMEWMNAQGVTIFLSTPVSILAERVIAQQGRRPLFKGLSGAAVQDAIQSRFEQRLSHYQMAHLHIPMPDTPIEEILAQITTLSALAKY